MIVEVTTGGGLNDVAESTSFSIGMIAMSGRETNSVAGDDFVEGAKAPSRT